MIKRLYHFLGGIKFAIFLITAAALFVIAGTFIESKTDSHAYAAKWTYESPLFNLLISGFFINILFSATRRWPFKKKHIPFLITHLGLLMILSGIMVKNYFGTQGSMSVVEGSGNDRIFLKETYTVLIDDGTIAKEYDLNHPLLQVLELSPHSEETLETWIKGGRGFIYGYEPFSMNESVKATLQPDYPDFELACFQAADEEEAKKLAEEIYLKGLLVEVQERKSAEIIYSGDLKDHANFILNFQEPALNASFGREKILIPLSGKEALKSRGNSPYRIALKRKPALLFIRDDSQDIFVFMYDKDGRIFSETCLKGNLNSILIYGNGFHGYSTELKLPLNLLSKAEMEERLIEKLKKALNGADRPLLPPLQLLKEACVKENLNFADVLVEYLQDEKTSLPQLDTQSIPKDERQACNFLGVALPPLMQKIEEGHDLVELLELSNWPFVENLKVLENEDRFEAFYDQVYSLGNKLPDLRQADQNAFFSAYLKLYGFKFHEIINQNFEEENVEISLECPLTARREKQEPHHKLEENLPLVKFKFNNEIINLTYDPFGTGLKWPTQDGRYTLRFQPKFETLPYRVRLQNARTIHYPNSNSSYSFEADLIITDKNNLKSEETTISMNNVHETWDGYRFYLSNITPTNETDVKKVQIVVNHDPAKYFLNYPGALILSLGIFLLFWFKR